MPPTAKQKPKPKASAPKPKVAKPKQEAAVAKPDEPKSKTPEPQGPETKSTKKQGSRKQKEDSSSSSSSDSDSEGGLNKVPYELRPYSSKIIIKQMQWLCRQERMLVRTKRGVPGWGPGASYDDAIEFAKCVSNLGAYVTCRSATQATQRLNVMLSFRPLRILTQEFAEDAVLRLAHVRHPKLPLPPYKVDLSNEWTFYVFVELAVLYCLARSEEGTRMLSYTPDNLAALLLLPIDQLVCHTAVDLVKLTNCSLVTKLLSNNKESGRVRERQEEDEGLPRKKPFYQASSQVKSPDLTCEKCRGHGHVAKHCVTPGPYEKEMTCHRCHGRGHKAARCPSDKSSH